MRIELWSDFNCPFCYMGETALIQALRNLNLEKSCEVIHYCYQLDPNAPKQTQLSFKESFMKKYDISSDEAQLMMNSTQDRAREYGLTYAMEKIIPTHTLNAHRLAKYVHHKTKDNSIYSHLYQAYFTDGKDLSSLNVLLELGKEFGCSSEELDTLFNSSQYLSDCLMDQKKAKELNVSGVPHFIVNGRYIIHGAYNQTQIEEKLKEFMLKDIKRRNHE